MSRVLVVEDESAIAELIAINLRHAGFEVGVAVDADQAQAAAYGINGVPFFVIDGKYGVSGAQPAEAFSQIVRQVWAEHRVTADATAV